MRPRNSSTSSSDEASPARWGPRLRVGAWALLFLMVLDVAVNLAFAYPSDPKNTSPSRLQLYFDYGRSMEGRLRRITRADPAETAPITRAGWYQPLTVGAHPEKRGGEVVTIYGMSHAMRLADALQRVSPHYRVRTVGAPGATANWSFGAFRRDRGRRQSKAVVLAIMSSTLPNITSMTPMTWNQSFSLPYTQDRYVLAGNTLRVIEPPYDTFAGYVATLYDPSKWAEALARFRRGDPFYDRFLFEATALDHSTLVRLARRAWANRRDRGAAGAVLDARHFDPNSEPVRVANAIVSAFAAQARADGLLPVIYMVNNYGYGDQLRRALQGTLTRERIAFVSSDSEVDPRTAANYLGDTHFTDANDEKLARALERVLDDGLKR